MVLAICPPCAQVSSMDAQDAQEIVEALCARDALFFKSAKLLGAAVCLGRIVGELVIVETTRAQLGAQLGVSEATVQRYKAALPRLDWLQWHSTSEGYQIVMRLDGLSFFDLAGAQPDQLSLTARAAHDHRTIMARAERDHGAITARAEHDHGTITARAERDHLASNARAASRAGASQAVLHYVQNSDRTSRDDAQAREVEACDEVADADIEEVASEEELEALAIEVLAAVPQHDVTPRQARKVALVLLGLLTCDEAREYVRWIVERLASHADAGTGLYLHLLQRDDEIQGWQERRTWLARAARPSPPRAEQPRRDDDPTPRVEHNPALERLMAARRSREEVSA